jgi:C4-dicarboxylate transporter DctM subunit
MTCGTVIIIVGASTLFGKILTYEQAPLMLANAIFQFTHNPTVVLLLIIALLYLLGMFMETLSTLIILVPVLLPVIIQLGIDPIHFGVILVLTNETALLTPPLGVNIFVSSRIAGISVERNALAVLPYVATLTFCVLTITFFPAIATWLPKVLGYGV